MLALLLKVVEDSIGQKSLTGIVAKVVVESQICDDYFEILQKMGISQFSLIDTYGLDHSKQADSNILIERYNKIFNVDYPDITVVFYVCALHKGTSSDLQQAISILYEQRPDLMSYIIGTYIDENELDHFTLDWLLKFDKLTDKKPTLQGQIIDYLYGDDIIIELVNNGVSEDMASKRTEVMRNRFAPFCGKKDIFEKNSNIKK